MNCGNRFQCGLTKSSRHQFKPDKPSNPILHHENQKRLNDLLKAREEIDKQFLTPSQPEKPSELININYHIPTVTNLLTNTTDTSNYTPWTIPSTYNYNSNLK
jgi:hypothetical protein